MVGIFSLFRGAGEDGYAVFWPPDLLRHSITQGMLVYVRGEPSRVHLEFPFHIRYNSSLRCCRADGTRARSAFFFLGWDIVDYLSSCGHHVRGDTERRLKLSSGVACLVLLSGILGRWGMIIYSIKLCSQACMRACVCMLERCRSKQTFSSFVLSCPR